MAVPPFGAGAVGDLLLVLLAISRPTVQNADGILNLPELPDQTCSGGDDKVCCAPNNYNPFFTIAGHEPEVEVDPLTQITEQDQMPQANIDSFINFKENGKKKNQTDLNSNQTEQTQKNNSKNSDTVDKTVKIRDEKDQLEIKQNPESSGY